MTDDFFDDVCEKIEGFKPFLDSTSYPHKTISKEYSDIVNQSKKQELKEEEKTDKHSEKESQYSDSLQNDAESGESSCTNDVSQPSTASHTQHSHTDMTKDDTEDEQEASNSQNTDENTESDESSRHSLSTTVLQSKKTDSDPRDDYSDSEELLQPSNSLEKVEKQTYYQRSEDSASTRSNSEEHQERIKMELIKKCAREKEKRAQAIATWVQRKRREQRLRRREQEKERKKRAKSGERRKGREREKGRERRRKEDIKQGRKREEEEAVKKREKRRADSREAYSRWLVSHPHHSRDVTSQAHTGDRTVFYYDRSKPTPPVFVNPQPWRRL
nr:uncharacterized protein LOC128704452 [Cherax quadricarinatus]